MDIFSKLSLKLVGLIDQTDPGLLAFFPHAVVFIGLPYLVCAVASQFIGRHGILQLICLGLGLFIAGSIPVPDLQYLAPVQKTWAIAICTFLILVMPIGLAKLITEDRRRQGSILLLVYLLVAGLFLLSFSSPMGIPWRSLQYGPLTH